MPTIRFPGEVFGRKKLIFTMEKCNVLRTIRKK